MNREESTTRPRPSRAVGARGWRALRAPLCLFLALGCGRSQPDVLLVSLDTVRADVFLEEARGIPDLARLLSEAVLYERGYTPMPFTLPAHMTVFTGLGPRAHGVDGRDKRLGARPRTLAEVFRASGYATAGFVNVGWLAGSFGFARGFDRYEIFPAGVRSAPEVTRRALEALREVEAGRPSFLFVHLFDAHSDAVPESAAPYVVDRGPDPSPSEADLKRLFCDEDGACATAFLIAADRQRRPVAPAAVATARELYRRGVRQLLADLAAFLAAYDEQRGLERTVLAVFSDHGEEFREHGRFLHSQTFEETVRVPIVLRDGRRPVGSRPPQAVEIAELFRTLLEVAGDPGGVSAEQRAGRDLLDPRRLGDPASAVFVQDKLFRSRAAVRVGNWKLHVDRRNGRQQLFDLESDPREEVDLVPSSASRAEELRRLLERKIARELALSGELGAAAGVTLSREEETALRALGYLQ